MLSWSRVGLGVVLCLSLVFTVRAADEKPAAKPEGKKPAAQKGAPKNPAAAVGGVFAFPKDVTLSQEQQDRLKSLQDEYAPKLIELNQKRNGLLTEEQKKARAEAMKAAKESGKPGKDQQAAIAAATNLTEDQKKQEAELGAAFKALSQEINAKKMDILTEEQKASLKKAQPQKTGEKKPGEGAKKPTEKKPGEGDKKPAEKKPTDKKPTEGEKKPAAK